MNILYQFDENYAVYAGVSIFSLLKNNISINSINIYILGDNLSQKTIEDITSLVSSFKRNVFFPETKHLLKKFEEMGLVPYRGTYSVYLRLFFSEFLDLSGERLIYIDADTIINNNLNNLFEYNLGEKPIGMVIESIRDKYKTIIGMDCNSLYYNSGVILFDVDKWIEHDCCNKIIDHINNVRSNYLSDQDFINIVCEKDICTLPLEYNFQPLHERYPSKIYFKIFKKDSYYSENEIIYASNNTVIYHCYRWLGEFPWHKNNYHPFNYKFDEYLFESPWKAYNKTTANISFPIRIEKFLYIFLPKTFFLKIFYITHEKMLIKADKKARNNYK